MSWTVKRRAITVTLSVLVTNAFRLLVCLGPAHRREQRVALGKASQTPFGFWYVLDAEDIPTILHFIEKMSQTPFGFWYVLDRGGGNPHAARGPPRHKRLSAFGMSWTGGTGPRFVILGTTAGHKRLSAFGMSWTRLCFRQVRRREGVRHKRLSAFGMSWTRVLERCKPLVDEYLSQTPFGFWYVLDPHETPPGRS